MAITELRRLAVLVSCAALFAAVLVRPAPAQISVPPDFADNLLATGLDWPTALVFLPDGRLLVTELKSGKIRMIVKNQLASTDPVGTVDSVKATFEEEGLYAIAVDPRWPVKPYVYVMYTTPDLFVRVSRFAMTGDLSDGSSGNLLLDNASRRDLIRDVPSLQDTHNGGALRFGTDQMLYCSFGEDANACMATDTTRLMGVLLRLEVRNLPDVPGPPDKALMVPPDNPYANRPNVNTRLHYARGLRNPFRFHIDAPTGRIFLADPGFQTWDEMDVIDGGGRHFGWPFFEATLPFVTNQCGVPAPPGMLFPSFQYDRHEYCGACAAAIIGGVVFRNVPGSAVSFPASYDGMYMFSDYYEGAIWRLRDSLGTWVRAGAEVGQPNARDWARGYQQVSDYVLGPDGAVYYVRNAFSYQSNTGQVRRIIYDPDDLTGVDPRETSAVAFGAIFPSPARGSAHLSYTLPRAANVRLAMFDALGRRVKRLVASVDEGAGEHRVLWDGTDDRGRAVGPGVYLAHLVVDGELLVRRIPLVR